MLTLPHPELLRADARRLRGLAIALALSVPLWAGVIGVAKLVA